MKSTTNGTARIFFPKGLPLSITANRNNIVLYTTQTHAEKEEDGKDSSCISGKPADNNSASSYYYYRTKTH
jgi:hypothetical protein